MKKVLLLVSFLAVMFSCADASKKKDKEVTNEVETALIALADFEEKAGEFIGKEVQVEGIVDHVCKHGGKKILLVNDDADVHVDSETRFDDALVGSEITVTGIVTEFRVDEAYLLKKEEDHIQNHKEGTDSEDVYNEKMEHLQAYRDLMKEENADHLSYYSMDYVSHEVIKEGEKKHDEEEHGKEEHGKEEHGEENHSEEGAEEKTAE